MIELMLQAERALSMGMVDRAEQLYWQAIESDSLNGIAIVGLAKVAIERGDNVTALRFARKALEIDPDNGAAQRIAKQLEATVVERVPKADPLADPAVAKRAADAPEEADAADESAAQQGAGATEGGGAGPTEGAGAGATEGGGAGPTEGAGAGEDAVPDEEPPTATPSVPETAHSPAPAIKPAVDWPAVDLAQPRLPPTKRD